ncbi:hypothetical protein F5B21DRAFT_504977 [Xylaria acuta]|nr:hypothetical protein F5B21DRAFT_504977 [Xylaria acuta]
MPINKRRPGGYEIDRTATTRIIRHPTQNDGSIQSANLNGSDIKYVFEQGTGVHTPKQMVIHQAAKTLYCCDREGLRIIRCKPDGSELEVLYKSENWPNEPHKKENATYWLVGITVSKKHNKFFWTQKGHLKANEGPIFATNLAAPAGPANRDDIELILSTVVCQSASI